MEHGAPDVTSGRSGFRSAESRKERYRGCKAAELHFLEDRDYLYFLHILKETKKKFFFDIFCFCLMPNHIHILLRINELNLSVGMKSLFTKYALYFNTKYQRKGYVFYGNYKAFLCLDDKYLITASIYIHLNPFKAKLSEYPWGYKWSSLETYINFSKRTFLDYKYILNFLDKGLMKASSIYKKILTYGGDITFKNILEGRYFRGKLTLQLFEIIKKLVSSSSFWDSDMDKYLERIRDKKRLKMPEDLTARKYLIEQLRSRGYTIKKIAQLLRLSRQSIYATLKAVT